MARGAGGLIELDLASGEVRAGPDLSAAPVPEGFELDPGFVSDVCVCEETLVVAVGVVGILAIDLTRAWPERFALTPLAPKSRTLSALRLAAHGSQVLVGALRAPAAPAHGAPYHPARGHRYGPGAGRRAAR